MGYTERAGPRTHPRRQSRKRKRRSDGSVNHDIRAGSVSDVLTGPSLTLPALKEFTGDGHFDLVYRLPNAVASARRAGGQAGALSEVQPDSDGARHAGRDAGEGGAQAGTAAAVSAGIGPSAKGIAATGVDVVAADSANAADGSGRRAA